MNKIYILLIVLLSFSCTGTGQRKQLESEVVEEKTLSKLEKLMLLSQDSVMVHYDLSNDSISVFPDLSEYTIKSLNLSHNQLDTAIVNYLPKGIIHLNLSFNYFCKIFKLRIDDEWRPEWKKLYEETTLREVDLSHNRLTGIDIGFPLRKIDISFNDITYINFNHGNIEFIDISHNPNLTNVVGFDPQMVDTIIRNNIANDKKLRASFWEPTHIY